MTPEERLARLAPYRIIGKVMDLRPDVQALIDEGPWFYEIQGPLMSFWFSTGHGGYSVPTDLGRYVRQFFENRIPFEVTFQEGRVVLLVRCAGDEWQQYHFTLDGKSLIWQGILSTCNTRRRYICLGAAASLAEAWLSPPEPDPDSSDVVPARAVDPEGTGLQCDPDPIPHLERDSSAR